MRLPRKHGLAAALVLPTLALAAVGCGGGSDSTSTSTSPSTTTTPSSTTSPSTTTAPSSAPGGRSQTVKIADFAYSPPEITVVSGTTVDFPNEDSTPHTATSKQSGLFDTGTIEPGKSAEVTFEQAGTFAYYCVFHPFMKGTITVE